MNRNIRDIIEEQLVSLVTTTLHDVIDNRKILYGWHDEETESVCQEVLSKIEDVCTRIKQSSEEEKVKVMKDIEDILTECMKLLKELKMSDANALDFPESMALTEILRQLTDKQSGLLHLKTRRLEKYEVLKDAEKILCHALKEKLTEESNGVPSEAYLDSLDKRVTKLNEFKEQLDYQINQQRNEVRNLMHQLEMTPVTNIELFCMNDSATNDNYTKDTLQKLDTLIVKLHDEQNRMIDEANTLRTSLSILWSRIDAPHSTREIILSECSGYTNGVIAKLKSEMKRCEEIKRANMLEYVNKIKNEVEYYWTKCCFCESDQSNFLRNLIYPSEQSLSSNYCTENVANLLETELVRLKEFYSKYESIYQDYEYRQELWNRLQQLEASTKDVKRLCNRGGALLKEENERKKIQKDLPRIEKKLKAKLDSFRNEESREFTIFGENLSDLIQRTWDEWNAMKGRAMKARKVATGTVSTVNVNRGTNQPGSARRLLTPATKSRNVSVKLHRGEGISDISDNTLHSTGSSTALSSKRIKIGGNTMMRNTPIPKSSKNTQNPTFTHDTQTYAIYSTPSNGSASSSYSLFKEQLEEKSVSQKTPCRSTLTPSNVLKPRNTPLPNHSSPNSPRFTPYHKTRSASKIASQKSPFKVCTSSKIPTLTVPSKSPKMTTQLRTPRRKLPIII